MGHDCCLCLCTKQQFRVATLFLKSLEGQQESTPPGNPIFLLGDFNALMGNDSLVWKDMNGRKNITQPYIAPASPPNKPLGDLSRLTLGSILVQSKFSSSGVCSTISWYSFIEMMSWLSTKRKTEVKTHLTLHLVHRHKLRLRSH